MFRRLVRCVSRDDPFFKFRPAFFERILHVLRDNSVDPLNQPGTSKRETRQSRKQVSVCLCPQQECDFTG